MKETEGKTLIDENRADIRSRLMELLKNEMPVLRAKARVSQEELAEKIGISRQTYSSIETGRRKMSWTTFLALFAYFQNNESTKAMLDAIDGLSEEMGRIMNHNDHNDHNNRGEVR